jgi:predicted glycosyltransferase involved in capsule biosynthesis
MSEYSVIIPVHEIGARGIDRVKWQILSLANQTRKPSTIFIPDSSHVSQFLALNSILQPQMKHFKIVHFGLKHTEGFNMPKLFNRALERVETEYVLCTGADFLYHPHTFEKYQKFEGGKNFLMKEVYMLPPCEITEERVNEWRFPRAKKNPWGRQADGIQYAQTKFFHDIGGYDERMAGWGGMDNDMHARAKAFGMNIHWVGPGIILHQYHKIEKGKGADLEQSKRNWALRDSDKPIVLNYIKPQL